MVALNQVVAEKPKDSKIPIMIDIKNWNLEQIISEPSSAAVTEVIKQNDAKVILKILFWITGALSKREGLNMDKFMMIDVK